MKTAVVLCGGGTKGIYEMGVWKALNELGVDYDIVTGSSIGAMNGALMVQQDYEKSIKLWVSLMEGRVVESGNGTDIQDLDDVYSRIDELRPTLKKYVLNRGVDVTPLQKLVESAIDELIVRKSPVDFGLVTVGFPSFRPYELTLKDIPEGQLHDYIMASSAIFPALPMHKINNELYLDGCYYDNLPIDLAIRMGAQEVIAVDLHETPVHPRYINCPFVKYIKPFRKLGKVLDFDERILNSNLELGYYDALKVLGKCCGFEYTYLKKSFAAYDDAANRFVSMIAYEEAGIARGNYRMLYKLSDRRPLCSVIESSLEPGRHDRMDYFIRGAEVCGEILGIEKEACYSFDGFLEEIERVRTPVAESLFGRSLDNLGALEILPALSEMKLSKDSAFIMQAIYNSLRGGDYSSTVVQAEMLVFPRELAAAIFLLSLTAA